jgi:tRNA-splicing ligase RtcB
MPDTHAGMGMPIGGVLATIDVVVPNAVGVDIGCGMAFVSTNVPIRLLREIQTPMGVLGEAINGAIMRGIPTGLKWHDKPQDSFALHDFEQTHLDAYQNCDPTLPPDLWKEIENGKYQLGTLGGGRNVCPALQ